MKYNFSHPDYPDNWIVNVPDDNPQKFDWMPCLETCGFNLTVGKQYKNIGYSSMGDRITVFDDNNKMILANLKCFIKPELLNNSNNLNK